MRIKGIGGCTMILLLSGAIFAASSGSLMEAVKAGDTESVRSLLKQHVDVNVAQADGATVLAWAAHRDELEIADLLIRAGANVNAADDYGVTPLSLACTNGSSTMVDRLLTGGADPNAAQRTGETVLMTCARTGNVDAVRSLLVEGADVNVRGSRAEQTALIRAVAQKHAAVALALIEHGADVRIRSKGGFTALLFAAQQGDLESTRILLAAGASVNEAAPDGMTPLLVASASGHQALAVFLLNSGADPSAVDPNGISALHYAFRRGMSVIGVRYFTSYLSYAFRPTMSDLLKALLSRGANPNARLTKYPRLPGFQGEPQVNLADASPFFLAAAAGDARAMRLLADNGADPLLATRDNTTPLMVAAGMGRTEDRLEMFEKESALEAVKLAVKLGADVNATNETGLTALHAAAYLGADTIIQFLADQGANVNAKDRYGQTPLSVAEGILPQELYAKDGPRFANRGIEKRTADLIRKLGGTAVTFGATPASAPANLGPRSEPALQKQ